MKKKQYDPDALRSAFNEVQKGMSVYKASRNYGVPESTLRDRTLGLVAVDGRCSNYLFDDDTEKKIVDHIVHMASIGYGYTRMDVIYLASDLAVFLGKRKATDGILSYKWYYSFLKRWPNLTVSKPQKLSMQRARCASKETLSNYYKELGTILTKHDLHDKPHKIFNIDESALQTEHKPGKIVHDVVVKPQSVTSPRSSNVTIIGAGNAIGNAVPPYYVFPGVKFDRSQLLEGTPAGSDGQCSKTGWSNSDVFKTYLEKHFLKYVTHDDTPLLILFDGHRSHVSLTLQDWAKSKNIILFILPPHCSHILQPLDIGCFGPLKACYNREAQLFMRKHPGCNITKFNIGQLSCSAYQKGLSAHNLTSSFKKSGIYPFNPNAVDTTELAPATIYKAKPTSDTEHEATVNDDNISEERVINQPCQQLHMSTSDSESESQSLLPQVPLDHVDTLLPQVSLDHVDTLLPQVPLDHVDTLLPQVSLDHVDTLLPQVPLDHVDTLLSVIPTHYTAEPLTEPNNSSPVSCSPSSFLQKRSIVSVKKTEKKIRDHFTITGHLGKKKNMDYLKCKKKTTGTFKPPFKSGYNVEKKTKDLSATSAKKKAQVKRKGSTEKVPIQVKIEKKKIISDEDVNAGLGTSGLNKDRGGPICLEDSDSDMTDDDDGDICCVCNKKSPAEIHQLAGIVFVKWAQCENVNCNHWTHLQFCSHVRVLRRGDVFFCPHCIEQ